MFFSVQIVLLLFPLFRFSFYVFFTFQKRKTSQSGILEILPSFYIYPTKKKCTTMIFLLSSHLNTKMF